MGDVVDFRPKIVISQHPTLSEAIPAMLDQFKADPPETDYQRGFEGCLHVLADQHLQSLVQRYDRVKD